MKHILFLSIGLVLATGCSQVQTRNGTIPADVKASVTEISGVYAGTVDNQGLSGLADNQRLMRLQITSQNGQLTATPSSDWLGAKCHSKIGKLENAEITGDTLKTATFEFDGGSCKTREMSKEFVVRVFDSGTDHEYVLASVTTGTSPHTEFGGVPRHTQHEARALLKKE